MKKRKAQVAKVVNTIVSPVENFMKLEAMAIASQGGVNRDTLRIF